MQHSETPTQALPFEKMTWEQFDNKYKPMKNRVTRREEVNGWLYETYGKDIEFIVRLANDPATANKVWTLMDDDNGNQCIGNGYHFVNRMGYFVCKVPFQDGADIFVQDEDDIRHNEDEDDDNE